MKLATYRTAAGAGYGVITDQGIVDLSRRIGARYSDLRALLAAGALDEARIEVEVSGVGTLVSSIAEG